MEVLEKQWHIHSDSSPIPCIENSSNGLDIPWIDEQRGKEAHEHAGRKRRIGYHADARP
jgi:hypothetical protein